MLRAAEHGVDVTGNSDSLKPLIDLANLAEGTGQAIHFDSGDRVSVSASVDFPAVRGNGVVFTPSEPMDYVIGVRGMCTGVVVEKVVNDSENRGTGFEVSGRAVNCHVKKMMPGPFANAFHMTEDHAELIGCSSYNAGYASIRADSRFSRIRDFYSLFTTPRKSARHFACNQDGNTVVVDGFKGTAYGGFESAFVVDRQGGVFIGSDIELVHDDYYTENQSNQIVKFEGGGTVSLKRVTSDVKSPNFIRFSGTTDAFLTECHGFGGINMSGGDCMISIEGSSLIKTSKFNEPFSSAQNSRIFISGVSMSGFKRLVDSKGSGSIEFIGDNSFEYRGEDWKDQAYLLSSMPKSGVELDELKMYGNVHVGNSSKLRAEIMGLSMVGEPLSRYFPEKTGNFESTSKSSTNSDDLLVDEGVFVGG